MAYRVPLGYEKHSLPNSDVQQQSGRPGSGFYGSLVFRSYLSQIMLLGASPFRQLSTMNGPWLLYEKREVTNSPFRVIPI